MVAVKNSGTIIESYAYDGRNFRVAASSSGTTVYDDHNDNWPVIEQRVGSSTAARAQFVWSAAYVDATWGDKLGN